MFRNQYDNDITTWSPQGRIHQIEYAMEAVKQGSAAVGIKGKDHVVVAALMRSHGELSTNQKKMFAIDDHVGLAISGLTSDARSLCRFLRAECLDSHWAFGEPLPVSRLVEALADKMQRCTQFWGRRPFGVGLLLTGYDDKGPRLYQVEPNAAYYDCKAMAIGARSQSAKTYLERHLDAFPDSEREELIKHSLKALRECLPSEAELTTQNLQVGIVGKDESYTIFFGDEVVQFLDLVDAEEEGGAAAGADEGAAAAADADGDAAMD